MASVIVVISLKVRQSASARFTTTFPTINIPNSPSMMILCKLLENDKTIIIILTTKYICNKEREFFVWNSKKNHQNYLLAYLKVLEFYC